MLWNENGRFVNLALTIFGIHRILLCRRTRADFPSQRAAKRGLAQIIKRFPSCSRTGPAWRGWASRGRPSLAKRPACFLPATPHRTPAPHDRHNHQFTRHWESRSGSLIYALWRAADRIPHRRHKAMVSKPVAGTLAASALSRIRCRSRRARRNGRGTPPKSFNRLQSAATFASRVD